MAVAAIRGELCGGFEGGECAPDRGGAFGTGRWGWEGFGGMSESM